MRKKLAFGSAIVSLSTISAVATAGPIEDLAPGEWYRVPNSHLEAVDPCPANDCSYTAVEGLNGIIDDWSGAAFDTYRDRLLVWGGGHGGYAGNEIYGFDLDTLKWERLTEPSDPVNKDVPYAPDGRPTSRHTYNYIQYVPALDALCSFGGAAFYETGQTGTNHTDCYSFGANAWQRKADSIFSGIGAMTAIDGATGLVWGKGTGYTPSYEVATAIGVYDPSANAFTARDQGNTDLSYAYYLTAAIDSKRHLMVAIGAGDGIVWDLNGTGNVQRSALGATGATEIQQANTPGLEYDPKSDRLIAWNGGATVYALDMTTRVWSRHAPAATNTVTPTAANGNGTFGRFRYSPQKNVFVVVNAIDQDVYIYRMSAGPGVTTPPPPPASSSDGGATSETPDATTGGNTSTDAGATSSAGDAGATTGGTSGSGGAATDGGASASPSATVDVACAIGGRGDHARDFAWGTLVTALALVWRRRSRSSHRRHRG